MFRRFQIGTLFGFPLEVNVSFLILLGAVGLFMGGLAGIFVVLLAFGSVLLHELGHALVARHLGVPIVGIELSFFGGAAKMGAQPKSAGDEIAIAAAGPAVSFALAGMATALYSVSGLGVLSLMAWVNLVIGLFNLVPALPMDGGRILRALLSRRMGFARATEVGVRIARGFSIALGVVGVVTLHLHLALLAVALWFMSSAELAMSSRGGYSRVGRDGQPMPRAQVIPPSARPFGPRRSGAGGGFVIRRVDGRFVIQPIPD